MQFHLNTFMLSIMLLSSNLIQAQSVHDALLNGTIAYEKGDYEAAEKDFKKAVEQNSSSLKGNFNLGNSLFKRQKFDEAAAHFQSAAGATEDQLQKSQALYNLGNARLSQAKQGMQGQGNAPAMLSKEGEAHLKEAIEAYKGALRNNSKDYDAKNNLANAYKLMRQQEQQKQQQQNKDQNKDQNKNENKDQNKDDNKSEQKDQSEDQNKNQNNDQNPPPPKEEDGQPNGEKEKLPKDALDRLMEIIDEEDKKVQKKLMTQKRVRNNHSEKEW